MDLKDGHYDCRKPAPGTPWGPAQTVLTLAEGIVHVTTAGHGGIRLSQARMEQIPLALKGLNNYSPDCWFEEDCEWAIPAVVFPEVFREKWGERSIHDALETFRQFYPNAYFYADLAEALEVEAAYLATHDHLGPIPA